MSIAPYVVPVVTAAFAIVIVVVGVGYFGWLKILKETNKLLKEQNEELKGANKDLWDKQIKGDKQMSLMQGQIDVLKSIPLVNIDTTLKEISKFNKNLSETNTKILERLEKSASLLIEDKGTLGVK